MVLRTLALGHVTDSTQFHFYDSHMQYNKGYKKKAFS